jgi:putative peptidoglycan lipid II flippase
MSDGDLLRPAATMATGTIASRITGMVRNSVLIAAIGTAVFADTYTVANTLPNILYILTIGGALNAVLIPQLVRRAAADADGGDAYTDRLLTAAGSVLVVITAAAMVLSPLLIRLYASRDWSADDLRISVLFALCCLPQIIFYGLFTVLSQILNVRGRFGTPMFAPILNNVVVIVTCLLFLAAVDGAPRTDTITGAQVALLGVGTTVGVMAQAGALAVVLRRAGYRYRPRFDLRGSGLGRAAGLAGWTLVLVAVNQVAYLLITRIATTAGAQAQAAGTDVGAGITAYATAHLVFVLPHSVIAVSVVTALFPRMSGHAAEGRLDRLRDDVAGALSALGPLLVPAAVALLLFGPLVAVALFNYGVTN